ncbi:Cobalamin (vitamin B12) biosynthesis CobK/CbiJ, precorrin-6x reductase [Candidatus Magnetoovum chiemensis]|nr:Cobalamin (vitamin B12) biosynthesis CobK/CbiJ, precorrin-6x reductase [Candidatus Magnetoovum chiemensis]
MNIAVLCITRQGLELALQIAKEIDCKLYIKEGLTAPDNTVTYEHFRKLSECAASIFSKYRGLIFIMSLGIVNRVIAPHLKSKYTDPAVVTIDEKNRYAISTLSGHEGGANELTYRISSITQAEPVITTATEANKIYVCAIGARKGVSKDDVIAAINYACNAAAISQKDLRCIATAWAKKDETGILEASKELGLYLLVFSKKAIDYYYSANPCAERSKRVYDAIGVYGVAEPCALLSGRFTKIVLPKIAYNGVTISIAKEENLLLNEDTKPACYNAKLILGGTNEAFQEADALERLGERFYISTATKYGYDHFSNKYSTRVIYTQFDAQSLRDFISANSIKTVIDCTHPYALVISKIAKEVCKEYKIEYVSKIRKTDGHIQQDKVITVPRIKDSVKVMKDLNLAKPLYTTGSKDLSFTAALKDSALRDGFDVYIRVLPYEKSIEDCVQAGIKRSNIIAMQGPFSKALNIALIEQYNIDCLITKRTGAQGGFYEKAEAAQHCRIWLIIVENAENKDE